MLWVSTNTTFAKFKILNSGHIKSIEYSDFCYSDPLWMITKLFCLGTSLLFIGIKICKSRSVIEKFFGCAQHPKACRNTQQTIFQITLCIQISLWQYDPTFSIIPCLGPLHCTPDKTIGQKNISIFSRVINNKKLNNHSLKSYYNQKRSQQFTS